MGFVPQNQTEANDFRDASEHDRAGRPIWQQILDDGAPNGPVADNALLRFLSPALQVYLRLGATQEFDDLNTFITTNTLASGVTQAALDIMNNGITTVRNILNPPPAPEAPDHIAAAKVQIAQALDKVNQAQQLATDAQATLLQAADSINKASIPGG